MHARAPCHRMPCHRTPCHRTPWARYLFWIVLLAVGTATYANSFHGQFFFDDLTWLKPDSSIVRMDAQRWWRSRVEDPTYGRPLTALSLALNYAVCGSEPAGYHVFNLTVHLLCGLMLFGVVRQALAGPPFDRPAGLAEAAEPLAFAVALIWLVHPLQSECVNYISQRTESMASLFFLAALYCGQRAGRRRRRRVVWTGRMWTGLVAVCLGLSALCKEIAAMAPLVLVLYDFAFRRSTWAVVWRRRWPVYLAAASCWLLLAILMAQHPRAGTVGPDQQTSAWQYLMNQCVVIVHYLELCVWPQRLLIDYGVPGDVVWSEAIPCGLLLAALFATSVWMLFRRPPLGFAGLWFFLLLAPTSSFLPILTEVGAERRMYLALAAPVSLFVAAVYLGGQGVARWIAAAHASENDAEWKPGRLRLAGWFAGALLLSGCATPLAARTARRNLDYRSRARLWAQSIVANPQNVRAAYNLAISFTDRGMHREAIAAYRKLLERWPRHVDAHNNLGIHYRILGAYRLARHHYETAIAIAPQSNMPIRNLAFLYATCPDPHIRDGARAVKLSEELRRRLPHSASVAENAAVAYAEAGRFGKALELLDEAERLLTPFDPPALARAIEIRREQYRRGEPVRVGN